MNQYNTGMRNASVLAKRIVNLKGNRFLNNLQGITLDAKAFIPDIRSWTQLHGFRMTDAQSSQEMLKKAAFQGIRSSFRTGAPSVYVLDSNKEGVLSVYYGNMSVAAALKSTLPDCHTSDCDGWKPDGFRFSGIVIGTLASENMAGTFASAGIKSAYIACTIAPVADSVAQHILAENRRLSATLAPYKSFQRVYGNSSRRVVEMPVQEVVEAIAVLKDECEFLQNHLSEGLACVAVRFGANDRSDFFRLANLIQSGMTSRGGNPGFEPVRCFELNGVFSSWRDYVSIPRVNLGNAETLQHTAHAVSFQSISDVASFCTAPIHSYSGYYIDCGQPGVDAHELFPVVPPIDQDGITVGKACNSSGNTVLPLSSLLCHSAVFGACNTGKTNVVMKVLNDAWTNHSIPFVVLEGAKKEYNAMLSRVPELRIFTPGADGIPLQINPLQPEDGVLIENHADTVVRAIAAATGAEHPIPEAFNGLLKCTYQRFGWEFGTMAYEDHNKPFPTFTDVLADVDSYIATSAQYGPEVRQNLTAALKIRCETFSSGALGRLFSKASGLTAKDFLEVPTVVELADFSEENTAFLMNILLFKFQSYLERRPASHTLNRLIVVEEAHNIFRKTLSEDTSLAKSNQAFDKMFAEIRASGTGLILSDQRPSIMPDSVLANTAVKVCLSMDSEDDRKTIGGAMGLSDIQRHELHIFGIGECIVTIRGHRGVFHVRVDKFAAESSFSASCMVCTCRFRCRKTAVRKLIADLPPELVRYHLSKVTANPYNISLLSANINHMLEDMHVTAAASTRLCLLGELLRRANIPMNESRLIVNVYNNYMKEEGK